MKHEIFADEFGRTEQWRIGPLLISCMTLEGRHQMAVHLRTLVITAELEDSRWYGDHSVDRLHITYSWRYKMSLTLLTPIKRFVIPGPRRFMHGR